MNPNLGSYKGQRMDMGEKTTASHKEVQTPMIFNLLSHVMSRCE